MLLHFPLLCLVNELYSAICYCQGLHPDPDLSEDDEEGERELCCSRGNIILVIVCVPLADANEDKLIGELLMVRNMKGGKKAAANRTRILRVLFRFRADPLAAELTASSYQSIPPLITYQVLECAFL